jgi:hypothetical protein
VPSKIRVQIWNLTHTFPDDLDMLLVSPTGTKFLLMSDAGGSTDVSNLSFVVDPNLVRSSPTPLPWDPASSVPQTTMAGISTPSPRRLRPDRIRRAQASRSAIPAGTGI